MSEHCLDGGSAALNLGRSSSTQTGMKEAAEAARNTDANTAPMGGSAIAADQWGRSGGIVGAKKHGQAMGKQRCGAQRENSAREFEFVNAGAPRKPRGK